MSSPYVAGPCLLYVGIGGGLASKAPVFLGTCRDTPRVLFDGEWEPFYNALGGTKVPCDRTWQGEEAHIQVPINKWNESVFAALSARPNFMGIRGLNVFGDLGTLMVSEGMSYPMWLRWPYADKLAYKSAGMPGGVRFLASWLADPVDLGNMNTKPREMSLVFQCSRVFDSRSLAWKLYDTVMTGLPAIN